MTTADFVISALNREAFQSLLEADDTELERQGACWIVVDTSPGYPCRVSLQDASIGERVLAVSLVHHRCNSPYRSSGPIFIREHAETALLDPGQVPTMLRHRLLSLRGYDAAGYMLASQVIRGAELESAIEMQFGNEAIEYLHVHNAGPGCYNCAVNRYRPDPAI